MTRKDYILIAAALVQAQAAARSVYADPAQPGFLTPRAKDALQGIYTACDALADALSRDNPRFDRARFLAAAQGV